MAEELFYKFYGLLISLSRKFIHFLHRAASGLELKDTILFSSRPDFSESTVEVFNFMTKMDEFKDYKFIWLCDNPRKQQHLEKSKTTIRKLFDYPMINLVNFYCESTAKCCIYTHQLLGNMYNEKQLRISISHGTFGLKRAEAVKKYFRHQYDYSTYLIHTFKNDRKNIACGLPRNDRLFDDVAGTRKKLGLEAYSKIIIWMPTFKHFRFTRLFHRPRNDYIVKKENDITLQSDSAFYVEVEKALKSRNILLIVKYHPAQDMKYVSTQETANIKIITDDKLSSFSVPLYSLLGAADALITDFSSVCYDYLLANKPIGFDITDLELYEAEKDDPQSYMPGEKIKSVHDFCDFIMKVADGEDHYEEARKVLLNKLHIHHDNRSTKRVVEFILSKLEAQC